MSATSRVRVLYVTSRNPISRLIRSASAVQASHCGVLMKDGSVWDVTLLCPVGPRRLDEWLSGSRALVYDIESPVESVEAAESAVRDCRGQAYDWPGVLGIPLWRDWQQERLKYCTELPNVAWRAGGVLLPPRRGRWDVGASLSFAWGRATRIGAGELLPASEIPG